MIKLTAVSAPAELTYDVVKELTEQYRLTGESVWNQSYIREALLSMSNNKCCYCECKIDEESKYLEVEHFKPKSIFPKEVVFWSNLLPSCKHCNGHKGETNTVIDPIINPTSDIPKNFLEMRGYRLYPRGMNQLGKDTIDVLDLNDRERLVNKRFEVGDEIQKKLYELSDDVIELVSLPIGKKKTTRKNRAVGTVKNLLLEAQPSSEYSATASTMIFSNTYYEMIKNLLVTNEMWPDYLQDLENNAVDSSLH